MPLKPTSSWPISSAYAYCKRRQESVPATAYTGDLGANGPPSRCYNRRIRTLTILLVGTALAVPATSQLKVFVEPREVEEGEPGALWIQADFSGPLKASISKFVPQVQLVANAEAATAVLRHTATERSRAESTAKRVFVGRGVAARASAELIDSCGVILWSESAKPGPAKVTDRIATRLKEAVGKGKIKPCTKE